MTEDQILSEISRVTTAKKSDVALISSAVFALIKSELLAGNSLTIRSFGRFESRIHSGRRAYDINNRRKYIIPPRWRLSFIPCEGLRSKLAAKPLVHPKPQQSQPHQEAQSTQPKQSKLHKKNERPKRGCESKHKPTQSVVNPTYAHSSIRSNVIRRRGVDRIYGSATSATNSR